MNFYQRFKNEEVEPIWIWNRTDKPSITYNLPIYIGQGVYNNKTVYYYIESYAIDLKELTPSNIQYIFKAFNVFIEHWAFTDLNKKQLNYIFNFFEENNGINFNSNYLDKIYNSKTKEEACEVIYNQLKYFNELTI